MGRGTVDGDGDGDGDGDKLTKIVEGIVLVGGIGESGGAEGEGPIQINPASRTFCANSAFSERNPYPG